MTGHLKMLQSPSTMNNAEGAASRFPAQASKFICAPLAPTSNPKPNSHSSPAGLKGRGGDQPDADLVKLNYIQLG